MTKKFENIKRYWDNDLIKIDNNLLDKLSKETRELYHSVGIPTKSILLVRFYNDLEIEECSSDSQKFIVIGDDYGTKIGILEQTDEVFSFNKNSVLPQRFINSCLEKFLSFLIVYNNYQPQLEKCSDSDVELLVHEIEEEFYKIDSNALKNEETWWSVILEQIKEGLI